MSLQHEKKLFKRNLNGKNYELQVTIFIPELVLCKGHVNHRVPTGTGKPGIPGKMRQLFPVREKSGNFEKMSKSQGILNESGKSQGKLIHKLKFNQSRIKILMNFSH